MESLSFVRRLLFPAPHPPDYTYNTFPSHSLYLPSPQGDIPMIFIPHSNASRLLLFSHGNGCDAGSMHHMMLYYQHQLKCHMLLWEYPGYGLFTHDAQSREAKPSESSLNACIDCVLFQFVVGSLKFPLERCVLMAQSIGTGCATALAARCEDHYKVRLGGLILQSPFTSLSACVQHITGWQFTKRLISEWWPNEQNIKACREMPLLIIHGVNDKIIPHSHAEAIFAACPSQKKHLLLVNSATHNV